MFKVISVPRCHIEPHIDKVQEWVGVFIVCIVAFILWHRFSAWLTSDYGPRWSVILNFSFCRPSIIVQNQTAGLYPIDWPVMHTMQGGETSFVYLIPFQPGCVLLFLMRIPLACIHFFKINFQSTYPSKGDQKSSAEEAPIHRIRITLTSRNVKSLEKGLHFATNWKPISSEWSGNSCVSSIELSKLHQFSCRLNNVLRCWISWVGMLLIVVVGNLCQSSNCVRYLIKTAVIRMI